MEKHVAKTACSEKKDHIGSIGSNWIKLDQIGLNFEKAILRKHFLKNYVLKEHGLNKTWSKNMV